MGRYAKRSAPPVPPERAGFERWLVKEPFRGPLGEEALPGDVIELPINYGGYRDGEKAKKTPSQALAPYEDKRHG